MGDAEDVDEEEHDRKSHYHEKNTEAWRYAYELDEAKVVSFLDVVDEIQDCKDPPRVPRILVRERSDIKVKASAYLNNASKGRRCSKTLWLILLK